MSGVSTAQFADWGSEPACLPGAGAELRQIYVKAGHVAPRHSHDHEQFLLVVSGGGRLTCESGIVALTPGAAIRLQAGAWHSAEFAADTVLVEFNLAPRPRPGASPLGPEPTPPTA